MVLNKKGVYNRCAVPELAVVHNSKLWEEEKRKFRKEAPAVSNIEDEDELLPIIERQLADKKRKQEDLAPQKKRGRKRIKEMWCGNHGPGIVWGEEVSEENKERSLFLEVKTLAVILQVRLKQTNLAPVGEVELLVIKLVRELAAGSVLV